MNGLACRNHHHLPSHGLEPENRQMMDNLVKISRHLHSSHWLSKSGIDCSFPSHSSVSFHQSTRDGARKCQPKPIDESDLPIHPHTT